MKRSLFPILIFLLMTGGCSSRTAGTASNEDSPEARLSLEAAPRQGFIPLRVTFRAELQGVDPNDKEYYCLQEIWDFGDGAKSSERPNCEPYSPESKIKTEFFMEHMYEEPGRYTVRFSLGEEDDEKIKSRQVGVTAIQRTTMSNPGPDQDAIAALGK